MRKESRVKRLFGEDGKAVWMPIDHGVWGNVEGLEDPIHLVDGLIKDGVDAFLMQVGMVKQTSFMFESLKNPPARIVTADYNWFWSVPGKIEDEQGSFLNISVKQAIHLNCDAVKVMLPIGLPSKVIFEHIKVIADLIKESDVEDIPVIVEPILPRDRKNDFKLYSDACRIAVELGADIIKADFVGGKDLFSDLVSKLRVPFVILGGPKVDSIRDVLQTAKDAVDAGARGPCFGRNVWGRPQVHAIVHALIDIVHKGATVEEVLSKYSLE